MKMDYFSAKYNEMVRRIRRNRRITSALRLHELHITKTCTGAIVHICVKGKHGNPIDVFRLEADVDGKVPMEQAIQEILTAWDVAMNCMRK